MYRRAATHTGLGFASEPTFRTETTSGSAIPIEEQRLFYVALTRARNDLTIYTPLRMPHHRHARDDKHSFAPASRFLDDTTLSAMEITESTPDRPATQPLGAARVALPTLDELWA